MTFESSTPKAPIEKNRSIKDFDNLSLKDFNRLLGKMLGDHGKVADEKWVEELSLQLRMGLDSRNENSVIRRTAIDGAHYFSVTNLENFYKKVEDFVKAKDKAIDLDRGGH